MICVSSPNKLPGTAVGGHDEAAMVAMATDAPTNPKRLARRAGLRYVLDDEPGYSRRRNGHGMVYLNARGGRLQDVRVIHRIEKLAIPPAWRDVWICRLANGHLQATGRDDRNRKQYLYHEEWHEAANRDKFRRFTQFGRLLPGLRRAVGRDMRGMTLTRTRVLAGIVALLDATSIRVGNEEYVRNNGSYGLTTLRTRHVKIERGRATLRFKGKSGIQREVIVDDKRLVRLLRQCRRLKGAHVFQFVDEDGITHVATAADVNAYLAEKLKHPFTAKSFRVWKASSHVAGIFYDHRDLEPAGKRAKAAREAIASAAGLLANTPTICRKYYVHPELVESFETGEFAKMFSRSSGMRGNGLTRNEHVLVRFLDHKS